MGIQIDGDEKNQEALLPWVKSRTLIFKKYQCEWTAVIRVFATDANQGGQCRQHRE